MEEGPVTMQVKIYDRTYEICYPSRLRMEELQTELATQCKGRCKPGSNRRFFVCIHCGRSDFSNKLRLNQHRFEEGCPGVRAEDGAPRRLLPYPDFKSGQGKLVEVLAKGRSAGVGGVSSPAPPGDMGTDSSSAGRAFSINAEDCSRAGGSIDTDTALPQPAALPPPALDVIVEAAVGCPREKLLTAKTPRKRAQTPKMGSAAQSSHRGSAEVPQSHGPVSRVPGGDSEAQRVAGFKATEDLFEFKIRLLNRIGQESVHKTRRWGPTGRPLPVEAELVPTVDAVPSTPTNQASVPDVVEGDPRSPRIAVTPVATSCPPSSSLYCPHQWEKSAIGSGPRLKGVNITASDLAASVDAVAEQHHSIQSAEPVTLNGGGGDVSVRAGGGVADKSGANTSPSSEDVATIAVLDVSTGEDALRNAVATMVVWDEGFCSNEDLLQYWAEGTGSPEPFSYHPEVEERFIARQEVLRSHEQAAEASAKCRADEILQQLIPPCTPREPAVPGLWHLRQWSDAKVPWVWAANSGDDFRRSWEERVPTDEFQNVLASLLYWWTYKKADSTISNTVRDAVSASVDALVIARIESVLYPDLHKLCTYVQYDVDRLKFQEDSRIYQERLALVSRDPVAQARSEFRAKYGTLREEILWDWCPLWRVLSRNDARIGGALPPLPWNHDDAEADHVREGLTVSRIPRMPPPPLAYVLRVMFWSCYGVFRQLTCPIYGITRDLLMEACVEGMRMKRALSLFMAQGPFLFSAVEGGLGPHLHQRLAWEIGQVSDGKGEDIIANVIAWVQLVQLRAVQDLAALPDGHFCRAWCTLQYQHWGVHGKHWAASLRLREDRDIGWVATTDVPQWSRRLQAVTSHLQMTVLHAGKCVTKDDDDRWRDIVKEQPGGDVILLNLPGFHGGEGNRAIP